MGLTALSMRWSRSLGTAALLAVGGQHTALSQQQQQPTNAPVDYLIIGSGLAAQTAFSTFTDAQQLESSAVPSISVITGTKEQSALFEGAQVITAGAAAIDSANHTVTLSDGSVIEYGRCLIAHDTASETATEVMTAIDKSAYDRVHMWTNIDDALKGKKSRHLTVVGGGWRGCETALQLALRGHKVSLVYNEIQLLHRYAPKFICELMRKQLEAAGVTTYNFAQVRYVNGHRNYLDVMLQKKHDQYSTMTIQTQAVLLAPTNLRPQADLALSERSHLEEDVKHGGLVVNSELQAATDLGVAGDSASIYSHSLGRHRASGDDHCQHSGKIAASNMMGQNVQRYEHIPEREFHCIAPQGTVKMFGRLQSSLETVSTQWTDKTKGSKNKNEQAIVYYLFRNRVVGVLLWNVKEQEGDGVTSSPSWAAHARQWLEHPGCTSRDELVEMIDSFLGQIEAPEKCRLVRRWHPASSRRSMTVENDDEAADFAATVDETNASTNRFMRNQLGGSNKFNDVLIHNIRTTSDSRSNPSREAYKTHLKGQAEGQIPQLSKKIPTGSNSVTGENASPVS